MFSSVHERATWFALAALSLLVAPACDSEATPHTHDLHWSYAGETGPQRWADLSDDYVACGEGTEQSPIDIDPHVTAGHVAGLAMTYGTSTLNILNNGHTVQANVDGGSSVTYGGKTYELVQFHFHAESEHTIDGAHTPMEMHLVHRASDGALAVVGVLIEEGAENAALADVFANLPTHEAEAAPVSGVTLVLESLLPARHDAWSYEGSLTTPPCTEGVSWIVMDESVEASAAQIKAFTDIFDANYRPTQALGSRTVHGAHWSYEGEAGPAHWGELAHAWEACETGLEQSPIDLATSVAPADVAGLSISWSTTGLAILNNGHTVQANVDSGSSITLGGKSYDLLQFHFHAESEHTVDGVHTPLEAHFVHKAADGSLAVIGLLIEEGDENAALAEVFANLPTTEVAETPISGVTLTLGDALPTTTQGWWYGGSLTTPPCSEGVSWVVMSTAVTASSTQIAAFEGIFSENFRPTQSLGDRVINAPPN
jgi:carbonic anhydrase